MKNIRRTPVVLLVMTVLAVLCLMSCREVNDTLYFRYADIPTRGWDPAEPKGFEVFPADSAWLGHRMGLELHVRYRSSQPVGMLPILVSVEDEEGDLLTDTLRLRLFHSDGTPMDAPQFGISEHTVTLMENFPLRKGLSVGLEPLAPDAASKGLLNVGIKLRPYGPDITAR